MPESGTAPPSPKQRLPADAVAPPWHTAGVILLLLALATFSLHTGRLPPVELAHHRLHVYLITIAAEWLIVAFIALGARLQGASLRTLVGENSPRWRTILRDLGLALAFLVAANLVLATVGYALSRFMHPATTEALKGLLPRSASEAAVFLLLALTAAFCEEMIFRGYLQRQFTVWTGSAAAGIALQAIAFGVAHAYQGAAQVIVIAVYGAMFGLLAHWRGSLRPGIIAHFLQDGVGGLLLARTLLK